MRNFRVVFCIRTFGYLLKLLWITTSKLYAQSVPSGVHVNICIQDSKRNLDEQLCYMIEHSLLKPVPYSTTEHDKTKLNQ
jgi:hypothetical protein